MPILSILSAAFAGTALFKYESGEHGLAALIICCGLLICAVASYGIQKFIQRWEGKLTTGLPYILLTVVLLMAGGVLYLSQAASRPINWTVSELQGRLLYYTDALQIITDYPLWGSGGGGWAALQYPYQTAMYSVNLVHNHFLQLALDTGIIGLLSFLPLLVLTLLQWKKHLQMQKGAEAQRLLRFSLFAAFLLLIHAMVDIDFSFPAIYAVFMFFLAVPFIMEGNQLNTEVRGEKRFILLSSCLWKSLGVVLLIGAILIWQASYLQLRGDQQFAAAKYDTAATAYQRSINLFPYFSATHYLLGRNYEQQALSTGDMHYLNLAIASYEEAHRLDSYSPLYLENLAFARFHSGDFSGSIKCLRELCQRNPMVIRHYENLAYVLVESGQNSGKAGSSYYRETLTIPSLLDQASSRLSNRAKYLRDRTDLAVSPRLNWKMGQSAYFLGNRNKAREFWQAAASDAAVYQEMRRWADEGSINLGIKK